MTVSATVTALETLADVVIPGSRMATLTSMWRMMRWLVWLMPAEVNSFSNQADEVPTDSIRTEMRGPRPASNAEPVRLPMGMLSYLADTCPTRVKIKSRMSVCRRLQAAILL